MIPSKEQAMALLREYNQEPFHVKHGQTVGLCMRYFAETEGFPLEADFWEVVGILHDIDFERWPQEHCHRAQSLLRERQMDEGLIHAVVSHGYGVCSDTAPEHKMEKTLFAIDELTGLIGAAALMRPSKSTTDMGLSSLKKKFKDKKFAAGCNRETIRRGADMLGWELDTLLEKTLKAMRTAENELGGWKA